MPKTNKTTPSQQHSSMPSKVLAATFWISLVLHATNFIWGTILYTRVQESKGVMEHYAGIWIFMGLAFFAGNVTFSYIIASMATYTPGLKKLWMYRCFIVGFVLSVGVNLLYAFA